MFHGNNTTREKTEEQKLASTSLFQGLLEPPEGVGAGSGLEASEIFEGREARKRKMVEQGEQVALFLIFNIFQPPDPPGGR